VGWMMGRRKRRTYPKLSVSRSRCSRPGTSRYRAK
jgi:hypothetical protein